MLALSSLIADFGVVFAWVIYSVFTFWLGAAVILVRRPKNPSNGDLAYIKYGFGFIALTFLVAGQNIYNYVQQEILTRL